VVINSNPQFPASANASRRLFPPPAAAKVLNSTTGTMAKWRCAAIGPAYIKIGGRVYYELSALDAFIDSCAVKPSQSRAG
jgi:hypothetical protein